MADKQDDLAKLSSINGRISQLYQAGKFSDAIPIAQQFLRLSEKVLGPDHPETGTAVSNLGGAVSIDRCSKHEQNGSATFGRARCARICAITTAFLLTLRALLQDRQRSVSLL